MPGQCLSCRSESCGLAARPGYPAFGLSRLALGSTIPTLMRLPCGPDQPGLIRLGSHRWKERLIGIHLAHDIQSLWPNMSENDSCHLFGRKQPSLFLSLEMSPSIGEPGMGRNSVKSPLIFCHLSPTSLELFCLGLGSEKKGSLSLCIRGSSRDLYYYYHTM